MANVSVLKVHNTSYNIKDATARDALTGYTTPSAVQTGFNNKVGYADYRTVTENSATKHYIYFYKNDSDAPVNTSTTPSTYLCRIDASPFIKDGMITSVAINNGNLVITWNSDSTGVTTPTTIPLTDIFNPTNYYDKDDIDGLIAGVQAGIVSIEDSLTSDDATKALSAKQGKVLNTNKAEKSELSITAVTGAADKKNIQLKSGTAQEVLIAHQDISGKADKSATVSSVTYDSTNKKIQETINGTTSDVVTSATIVADGGAVTDISYSSSTKKITKTKNGSSSDVVTLATVATSGSYDDLSNKPTIPSAPGSLDTTQTTAQSTSASEALSGSVKLHKIAKTGTYSDLISAPTNVSSFTNDAGYQTSSQVSSAISSTVYAEYISATETIEFTIPAAPVS